MTFELKWILESLLFAAQKPLTPADLRGFLNQAAEQSEDEGARAFRKVKVDQIETVLAELAAEHAQAGRTYRLVCVAGAWQFASQPEYAPWLRILAGEKNRPSKLSLPALETLTIIAYRQPITRAEIEQIRGVAVDGVMQTLLERELVAQGGRAEVVGRPMMYGTTKLFLEYFGLRSLEDLPAADELRRIPVERPPSLITADPGLATVAPEQLTLPSEPAAAAAETTPEETAPPAPESQAPENPAATEPGASPETPP